MIIKVVRVTFCAFGALHTERFINASPSQIYSILYTMCNTVVVRSIDAPAPHYIIDTPCKQT